jgi:hypothetical protein
MLPADPKLVWTAYRLPKLGHSEAECEDAYAGDAEAGRFAVADGASESAFALPWAEALAAGYVAHPGRWSSWLPAARAGWQSGFEGAAMPWYVEAKFLEGAFATLVGLALRRRPGPNGRLSWRALAVGDSCLFHVRGDCLRRAFPVKHAAEIGNRPALLGSRQPPRSARCKRFRAAGSWRPGDTFLLMTDALAQWFLQESEAGRWPWDQLGSAQSATAFAALVNELREAGRLRNDDTTLLAIQSDQP